MLSNTGHAVNCRVAKQNWQRKRQYVCLVAEHRSSQEVVASCVLSLAAPDAVSSSLTVVPVSWQHTFSSILSSRVLFSLCGPCSSICFSEAQSLICFAVAPSLLWLLLHMPYILT